MADLEKSVAIIFEGVDQMGSGVDSATKRIDGVAEAVQQASRPLADFTKDVFAFEGALLAAGAAVTGFAIKLAGDFDSQFREISTLIDEPTESLAGFRQEILDYSGDSTQALDTINSALYNAISAGVDYTDSLDVVAQAERAAVAGKAELDQSLTVLVSSLNAYGAGMDEAEHFSDLLFQTVKNGVTTLPELGGSLSNVTGLAATAGVSFEELLAAVATLTATGSSTSSAITQIRGAISTLLKPTKEASDLADELGIEFNAAALESRGLSGVLADVAQATGGNTEQMAQLFGQVEALNGVMTLTGLGADRFADNIEAMGDATGATEEAYQRMAGTVEQGSQRIKNAMTTALIALGDPLLDEFGGIQEAIAAIFNAIGASVSGGQLEGFVDQIESLFQGMEDTLREVAANLPAALEEADFSGFFDGIEMVRDAVANLFDGADLSTVEGLVSVIETLGLGFETLAAYTAGAITAIGPFLEQAAELARWILELDPALIATVGSIGGLALALNTLSGAATTVTGILRGLAGSGGVVAKAAPIIRSLVGVLAGPLGLAAGAALAGTAIVKAGADILGFTDDVDAATQEVIDQNKAIDDGRQVWDYAVGEWVAAGEAQEDLAARTARMNQELQDAFNGVKSGTDALADHRRAIEVVNAQYQNWDAVVDDAWKSSESFRQEQEATADALRSLLLSIGPVGEAWQEVSDNVFEGTSNVADLEEAYDQIKSKFDQGLIDESQFKSLEEYYDILRNGLEPGAEALRQMLEDIGPLEEGWQQAADGVYRNVTNLGELENAYEIIRRQHAQGLISDSQFQDLERYYDQLRDGSISGADAQRKLAESVLTTEEAILEAREAVLDYELDLEKLASNERIAAMEFTAEINVASIEADARKVEAVMGSLATTVDSTGQLLDSLFSHRFGNDDLSRWAEVSLDSAIRKEQESREAAIKTQNEYVKAMTESLKARTEALRNGEGLIKIDSTGLEPALEMILWEVLEKIQLRANAEGTEFLLGLNGSA